MKHTIRLKEDGGQREVSCDCNWMAPRKYNRIKQAREMFDSHVVLEERRARTVGRRIP